jgi:Bacterial protein of unknown function (DUF899)
MRRRWSRSTARSPSTWRTGPRPGLAPWTNGRGVEVMDYSYALMDLTVYGRQEAWEDSPVTWPRREHYNLRTNGRPIAQWPRLAAGRSDNLGNTAA